MFGFDGLLDVAKKQMDQARLLCYQYTGSRVTAWSKWFVTYVFHYLPEKFFLFFLAILTVIMGRVSNPVFFLRAMDVIGFLYKILKYPSDIWLSYFCKKEGVYESVVVKMWKSPVVPFNVLIGYMNHNGHTCPSPE